MASLRSQSPEIHLIGTQRRYPVSLPLPAGVAVADHPGLMGIAMTISERSEIRSARFVLEHGNVEIVSSDGNPLVIPMMTIPGIIWSGAGFRATHFLSPVKRPIVYDPSTWKIEMVFADIPGERWSEFPVHANGISVVLHGTFIIGFVQPDFGFPSRPATPSKGKPRGK